MPCKGCEERRQLIVKQIAAVNAAAQAKAQAALAAIKARIEAAKARAQEWDKRP
jgi:hypothetical protein